MDRLNVLFIVIDDLNTWLGAYGGHPRAKTPHMDALAASSAVFKRTYCSAPYCNASRMGFFTGSGATHTGIYSDEPLDASKFLTMPEVFRQQGYYTFAAGKVFHGTFDYADEVKTESGRAAWKNLSNRAQYWDECYEYDYEPLPAGRPFNSIFGDLRRPDFPPGYAHFDWAGYDDEEMPDGKTAGQTIDFLARRHIMPFFCAMGLYRPHLPWFAPSKYFDLYPLESITLPPVKRDDLDDVPPIGVQMARAPLDHDKIVDAGLWRKAVRAYLACVSYCDDQVGVVLGALERSAYRDNTMVDLLSDNGFHHGQKLHWSKFALWEEASRVPLMVRVPGSSDFRGSIEAPVSLLDVLPTLLELCHLPWRGALDGESLLRTLACPDGRRSPVPTTWQAGNHSLRERGWRYTLYSDEGEELYDHITDPFEWHNLAHVSRFDPVRAEMASKLRTALA